MAELHRTCSDAPVDDAFADLFKANARYAARSHEVAATGVARRGLAVVTCIDSRIDPLAVFGLVPGDAKILRNAGARITDDVERSLALAVAALGVTRVAVVQHTDCKLTASGDEELIKAVAEATGRDLAGFEPLAIGDQQKTLKSDQAMKKITRPRARLPKSWKQSGLPEKPVRRTSL